MKPVLDQLAAKKRIRRFFDEPLVERRATSYFIDEVSVCADVFVFGGALRDISLFGVPYFSSDLDIVVQVHDKAVFTNVLNQFGASQNKFGGHRLWLGRWGFDVWEVAQTWAFSVGAVEPRSHLSLLETTFFNWDAILYDWRAGSLHHGKSYFSDLAEKYLELVLEENPNNTGAFVRALRTLCLSDEIVAGPRLSKFIKKQFDHISNIEILSYESHSFTTKRLSDHLLSNLRGRAAEWSVGKSFRWLPKQQLSFFEDWAH